MLLNFREDSARRPSDRPEKILLDTDIGTDVDDALALILAARSPELEIISVTTVGAHPEVRASLARRLLSMAGKVSIPVTAGLADPLPSNRFTTWLPHGLWMGHEGKGVLSDEEIEKTTANESLAAVDRIISTLMDSPDRITVVTIGPLTNLAAALLREPRIAERIEHLIVMGGCIIPPKTVGREEFPVLKEFNFNYDREATAVVLGASLPVTLMPVEVTIQGYLTAEECRSLRSADPVQQSLANLLEIWEPIFRGFKQSNSALHPITTADWACHLHDPMALLMLLEPQMMTFQDFRISLRESEGVLYTQLDPEGDITVRAAVTVNIQQARRFILDRLRGCSEVKGKVN